MSEYYRAYEERYRAVQDVGDFVWGHTADDARLAAAVSEWVETQKLSGRRVAEFACGEGAGGVLLCGMGCAYEGYDLAPTAVEKTRRALKVYPGAKVGRLDMVKQRLEGAAYDGAMDISGLHMLVTDGDREKYLGNVFHMLRPGGTALFWQEAYNESAYAGRVECIEDWKRLTGLDFDTPEKRKIGNTGREVMLRLLPARPRSRAGYIAEFEKAGFEMVWFREIRNSDFMAASAGMLVRKPVL